MFVLVTGGSGFIGSHVVEELLARGHTPVTFDHHRGLDYFEGVESFLGNICDPSDTDQAVSRVDVVIHLAAILGTAETVDEPGIAVETNVVGALNVFQACRRYSKPCVYISVGNYWMNSPYSITKDTAERFAWMFNTEYGTKITIVRALNAYGPRQRATPVRKIMPSFVLAALRGEDLIVYGDGAQIMDMIYVTDVAKILVQALVTEHDQYVYEPAARDILPPRFEAGTGRRTTVQEIAEEVVTCTDSSSVIRHVPMRAGEPERAVVLGDPETLRPLFGGQVPEFVSLSEGIAKTVEYYKQCAY